MPLIAQHAATAVPEAYVVEVSVLNGRRKALKIEVDTDSGIRLEQCIALNRSLREALDAALPEAAEYELEVQSPGVGSPLRHTRQYTANVGRLLNITTTEGRTVEGTLTAFDGNTLTLVLPAGKTAKARKADNAPLTLPLSQVKKAAVQAIF